MKGALDFRAYVDTLFPLEETISHHERKNVCDLIWISYWRLTIIFQLSPSYEEIRTWTMKLACEGILDWTHKDWHRAAAASSERPEGVQFYVSEREISELTTALTQRMSELAT